MTRKEEKIQLEAKMMQKIKFQKVKKLTSEYSVYENIKEISIAENKHDHKPKRGSPKQVNILEESWANSGESQY